jgi:hypothetical protein
MPQPSQLPLGAGDKHDTISGIMLAPEIPPRHVHGIGRLGEARPGLGFTGRRIRALPRFFYLPPFVFADIELFRRDRRFFSAAAAEKKPMAVGIGDLLGPDSTRSSVSGSMASAASGR